MALSKKPVNGMKDILPKEMKIRDYVMRVIKDTYATFGFTSIETPCMENIILMIFYSRKTFIKSIPPQTH